MDIGNQSGEPVIYVADNGGPGGEDPIQEAIDQGRWCSDDCDGNTDEACSGQLEHGESHLGLLGLSSKELNLKYYDETGNNLLAAKANLLPIYTATLYKNAAGKYEIRLS
ncbi:MAG: hypothetical protein K0U98_05830 [Deltaproteobacteria bacterium]|nr:hypothetical protein [Deltaproteobacteria bacterium]